MKEAVVAEWLRKHCHCSALLYLEQCRRALSVGEWLSKPSGQLLCCFLALLVLVEDSSCPLVGRIPWGSIRCRLKSTQWATDLRAVQGYSEVTSLGKGSL